jgi:penicillin V acylase-like amidase (Ntn superfamily)
MNLRYLALTTTSFALSLCIFIPSISEACTRILYQGKNNQTLTARTLDWKTNVDTNLWIFPRGMKRNGAAGANSIEWTSKYGSVIASGFDIATLDGMNEKGLVANALWLVETEYPKPSKDKPGLSIAAWVQYVLDNFETVEEAVKALKKEPYYISSENVPGQDLLATLHLSISDASGDSAVIEYVKGEQHIHHSREYQVMTNSPTYDKQLALNDYWESIGGTVMLPGTNRAADRFARASFYVNAVPQDLDQHETVGTVFSVIRNVSVPFGISTENQPNIASTYWRTVSDQKEKLYFYESTMSPSIYWVDLKNIDFSAETGHVKKLDLVALKDITLQGNVNDKFANSEPFKFLGSERK